MSLWKYVASRPVRRASARWPSLSYSLSHSAPFLSLSLYLRLNLFSFYVSASVCFCSLLSAISCFIVLFTPIQTSVIFNFRVCYSTDMVIHMTLKKNSGICSLLPCPYPHWNSWYKIICWTTGVQQHGAPVPAGTQAIRCHQEGAQGPPGGQGDQERKPGQPHTQGQDLEDRIPWDVSVESKRKRIGNVQKYQRTLWMSMSFVSLKLVSEFAIHPVRWEWTLLALDSLIWHHL